MLHHQDIDDETQRLNNRLYGDNFTLDERRDKKIPYSNNISKDRFKKDNRTERNYTVKNPSDSIIKSNNINSDVSHKRPNYSIDNVTDSSDCKRFKSNNSNNSEKIYEKKFEETTKRSDSPATVTSSQPQKEPKYDVNYADTRPSYEENDDKIQENTVSASSELPDYIT